MVIFSGPRGVGKTESLIKLAAKNNYIIICHSDFECERIKFDASAMGLCIEDPITYEKSKDLNQNNNCYVIDNLDSFLKYVISNNVVGFSVC